MRRLLAAAAVVLFAREARADGADEEPTLQLRAARAVLDGTAVHLTASFTIHLAGPEITRGIMLTLPHRGVVTGATVHVDGPGSNDLHALGLVPTADALTTIDGLAERAGGASRRWGVRIVRQIATMTTVDFAVPRAANVGLELEISAPTCFRHDARFVAVPTAWLGKLDRKLVHRGPNEELDAACPDAVNDEHAWLEFPVTTLAHGAPIDGRIGTSAQGLAVTGERIARVELDLAGRLGEVPNDLATAIVIDGSRSVTGPELELQRAIVESYLRAAPRSRVQVIAYAHTAKPLLPGWMTASQALPRVDRELRGLAQRNGSDVDAGLAEAAAWLARTTGTRRIVVLTDERFSQRLLDTSATTLKRLVPADTVVHIVALGGGGEALIRDEAMMLAPLAQATDGIAVRGGSPDGPVDAELLVRPIAMDDVAIIAPGWTAIGLDGASCATLGSSLAEGSSCTWWAEGTPNAGPITIAGLVWGRRVQRVVQPDLGQGRTLARELAELGGVTEAIQAQVEREAHAVTERFALLATWGGGDGYADVATGGFGFGTSGCGCGSSDRGGIRIGHIGTINRPVLDLQHQLATAIEACHRGDRPLEITLETTVQEIVGVSFEVAQRGDESPLDVSALHDCIEAAIWDTAIVIPNAPEHTTTTIKL